MLSRNPNGISGFTILTGPRICAPNTLSVDFCPRIFTMPSVSAFVLALLLAANGNFPTLYSIPCERQKLRAYIKFSKNSFPFAEIIYHLSELNPKKAVLHKAYRRPKGLSQKNILETNISKFKCQATWTYFKVKYKTSRITNFYLKIKFKK